MSKKVSRRHALITTAVLAAGVMTRRAEAQSLGSLDALTRLPSGATLPTIQFFTPDNQKLTLAHYRGKGVVLNLWATWCGPCVAELPTLDRMAGALASQNIVVLPVSSDAGGAAPVQSFYDSHGIDSLPILLDPGGAILQSWHVPGIPLTVIFDRNGHPRAKLLGATDWSTPQALALVTSLTGPDLSAEPVVKI
ncbi:TlpA family protein disulfide reductase [Acidisoma cellulosilytica]|uniref:TlpA family protein disulfide reductase n=1 Tax=Acidisoma cellulosilyticum TaxID=2802395 RepID=A0A963Z7H5_9PROT|nr:TlpA disulfide reductase family protein [Acidisoma cellulosilyticum]MCB8883287.1 TlpA family protein disulfide reductase [Acidisoma cellulosilyticum]